MLLDLTAEVSRFRISVDRPFVTHHFEISPDYLVEGRPLGPRNLDCAVAGSGQHDLGDDGGDVIGSNRLK
jgi:hypothetical protein